GEFFLGDGVLNDGFHFRAHGIFPRQVDPWGRLYLDDLKPLRCLTAEDCSDQKNQKPIWGFPHFSYFPHFPYFSYFSYFL
ncbi:MAG: hypothetical protein WAK96_11410, partial [Desulfobaccales bacterium]